jgi:hypothetical protein
LNLNLNLNLRVRVAEVGDPDDHPDRRARA